MGRPCIRRLINKICLFCGDNFPTKDKNRKFCCHKCSTDFNIGGTSWNVGLTKETDSRMLEISNKNKGKKSWNDGLTKYDHPALMIVSQMIRWR